MLPYPTRFSSTSLVVFLFSRLARALNELHLFLLYKHIVCTLYLKLMVASQSLYSPPPCPEWLYKYSFHPLFSCDGCTQYLYPTANNNTTPKAITVLRTLCRDLFDIILVIKIISLIYFGFWIKLKLQKLNCIVQ